MGLFNKLKNILFEEEEVEIPVITKEEQKKETPKPKIESTIVEKTIEKKTAERKVAQPPVEEVTIERDIFKAEPTFEFPVFDENDFSDSFRSRSNYQKVLEQEKAIKKNRKLDFGKYETKEVKETPKVFKPSPIISPVYGVLDQNYKKDDILPKTPKKDNNNIAHKVDIDSIRNKAYGTLEDDIEGMMPLTNSSYLEDEPSPVTKTIDELLLESIDEQIPVAEDKEIYDERTFDEEVTNTADEENESDEIKISKALNVLDELETDLENTTRTSKEKIENDTLETDLFNLIDSMYENREDGEV